MSCVPSLTQVHLERNLQGLYCADVVESETDVYADCADC